MFERISESQFEGWYTESAAEKPVVRMNTKVPYLRVLAVCHSMTAHTNGEILSDLGDCRSPSRNATFSVAFHSESLVDRVIQVTGRIEPECLLFQDARQSSSTFAGQCEIPGTREGTFGRLSFRIGPLENKKASEIEEDARISVDLNLFHAKPPKFEGVASGAVDLRREMPSGKVKGGALTRVLHSLSRRRSSAGEEQSGH